MQAPEEKARGITIATAHGELARDLTLQSTQRKADKASRGEQVPT